MLCAGVPVRFRVVLAVQVLVNVALGFVEYLHEREGCTRRHLFCQHGCVLRQPCSHYGFGCISFRLAFPVHQIQQLHNKGLWQIVQHFFQRVRIFVQQGRRAQLRHEIQIVTGYRLLAVVDALTGVIQHIFDCILCRVGKLLHQSNTVCKADLRLVSFAGAAARLIGRVDDAKFHSQPENVLAGLFALYKIVAGAACKAGLVRLFAGSIENPGFVFLVHRKRAGLALLGAGKALFFVSVCGMLCPGAEGGNHSHNGKPPFRVSLLS